MYFAVEMNCWKANVPIYIELEIESKKTLNPTGEWNEIQDLLLRLDASDSLFFILWVSMNILLKNKYLN